MDAAWVAGQVRAVGLLNRRLGAAGAHEIAAAGSLTAAQRRLGTSPYRHRIRVGASLFETEYALAAEALWQLRVLAGWQPRAGATTVRLLAGGFDIANIGSLAASLAGADPEPAYELGALGTAWPRVRDICSSARLRDALRHSPWGDPGGDSTSDITFGLTIGWADRIAAGIPQAARWAVGGVALMTARQRLLTGRALTEPTAYRVRRMLGSRAANASDLATFRAALPVSARWALADVDAPDQLWRAEFGWWSGIERDARELVRRRGSGSPTLVGVVALLVADAWRTRAAVQAAAAEQLSTEVFDDLLR